MGKLGRKVLSTSGARGGNGECRGGDGALVWGWGFTRVVFGLAGGGVDSWPAAGGVVGRSTGLGPGEAGLGEAGLGEAGVGEGVRSVVGAGSSPQPAEAASSNARAPLDSLFLRMTCRLPAFLKVPHGRRNATDPGRRLPSPTRPGFLCPASSLCVPDILRQSLPHSKGS